MLTIRVWLGLVVWLIATAVIGFLVAPRANVGFADGAAVLSFATLAAVGIERILELMWSFASASQRAGGWWPLKQVTDAIDTVLNETNAFLGDHVKDTITALNEAKKAVEAQPAKVKEIDDTIASITAMQESYQAKLDQAQKLAPGSERVALIAALAADASSQLKNALGLATDLSADATKAITKSDEAIDFALTIVSSFSDNPARRVASILIGGGLGIVVAGFVGLNIFAAVLGEGSGYFGAGLGVILTGFIVGLGSSPTHEVIKGLQNYKSSRGTMVATQSSGDIEADDRPQIVRRDGQRMVAATGEVKPQGGRRVLLRGTQ